MSVIIAVDPGVTGAIGVLDSKTGDLVEVIDVPVVTVNRKELSIAVYYDILTKLEVKLAAIEKVTAFATQGTLSAFTFGGTYIAPQCFCTALNIPFELVPPVTWKKAFGLHKVDKDASRKKAMEIYPTDVALFKRVKDHNRADAVLIARYLWEKHRRVLKEPVHRNTLIK